jgi:hypothetical protein
MKPWIRRRAAALSSLPLWAAPQALSGVAIRRAKASETPTVMSTSLTFVEIRTAASATSDYIHLTGYVLFRISGVMLKSGSFPPGAGMSP